MGEVTAAGSTADSAAGAAATPPPADASPCSSIAGRPSDTRRPSISTAQRTRLAELEGGEVQLHISPCRRSLKACGGRVCPGKKLLRPKAHFLHTSLRASLCAS